MSKGADEDWEKIKASIKSRESQFIEDAKALAYELQAAGLTDEPQEVINEKAIALMNFVLQY